MSRVEFFSKINKRPRTFIPDSRVNHCTRSNTRTAHRGKILIKTGLTSVKTTRNQLSGGTERVHWEQMG